MKILSGTAAQLPRRSGVEHAVGRGGDFKSVVDSQSKAQKQEVIKKGMVNDWLMIIP